MLFTLLAALSLTTAEVLTSHKLVGLFPVSVTSKSTDSSQGYGGECPYFAEDGWFMMLAMDYAIQQINSKQPERITLSSHKLDTCSGQPDYWMDRFSESLDETAVVGIVGASYSSSSKLAAHISTVKEIPMISYQSSATSIQDIGYFPYFFRTIPMDNFQAQAMRGLLTSMNLTYIAMFYSDSAYGIGLKDMLTEYKHNDDNICVLNGGFPINEDTDYSATITKICEDKEINAIAVFGYREDVTRIKDHFNNMNVDVDKYVWIASDGWAQFDGINPGLEKVIGTSFSAPTVLGFSEYYNNTMRDLAAGNFTSLAGDEVVSTYNKFHPTMRTSLSVAMQYEISYITPVVEAVIAFSDALQEALHGQMIDKFSTPATVLVDILKDMKYDVKQLFNVEPVRCCGVTDITPKRLTYGTQSYGSYLYTAYSHNRPEYNWRIGSWDNGATNKDHSKLMIDKLLENWNTTNTTSMCRKCANGQVKYNSSTACCADCRNCSVLYQFTDSEHDVCYNCTHDQHSSANRTGCKMTPLTAPSYSNTFELCILIISFLGICSVTTTYWYMFILTYTPIARASGRAYMTLLTICMVICFLAPFILFAMPGILVCMVQRLLVAAPTVGIIASCLVKTFSIDRIFRKPGIRQKLLSKRSMIILIMMLIFIEIVIESIVMVAIPSVPRININQPHVKRSATCTIPKITDTLLTFAFPGMLMFLCGVYALRIRKVPQKYNESRCIIFTILILLFETLLFTINIKTVYHQYILFYAVCIITGTYTSFFALFLPKLYIIIFKPERNTLQLQCHTPTPFGKTRTFDKGVNTSCSLEELQDKMEVTEMTGTSIDFTSERDV